MGRKLVVTDAFGAYVPGDTISDAGLVAGIEGCEQYAFAVVVPGSGLSFDGDASTAALPSLSSDKRTATWTLGNSMTQGFVLSADASALPQGYVHFVVNASAPFAGIVMAGLSNVGLNVNALSTSAGHIFTAALGESMALAVCNGDSAALGSQGLAVGPEFIVYWNRDAGSWGVVTPDNVAHDNLQSASGGSSHNPLGMPAGPYYLVAGPIAEVSSGTATLSISAVPGPGSLTAPAGYVDALA